MYINVIKPTLDLLIAILLLIISLPLFLIISVLLLFSHGESIFFIQKRIGLHEKPFNIIKFRTMSFGVRQKEVLRITPIGKILRATHLDELPQLINIIKGDLSLIGPRPLLPEYLPYYNKKQSLRHLVKPGILGLSQSKGGNHLQWKHRLIYDSFYARHASGKLDMYIVGQMFRWYINKKGGLDDTLLLSDSFIESLKKVKV